MTYVIRPLPLQQCPELRVSFLATAASIALAGCGIDVESLPAPALAKATAVVTDLAQVREHAMSIEAIGTTHARESVLVTSRVSGRVSRIFLTEGAHAAAGDPLVLLEDDAERAGLRSAAATVAEVEAQLRRIESLAATGLVARYDLDRQHRAVEAAQAELQLRQVLLDQRTIRAPFAGVIGFRQVSPGTLVQPGASIVSLDACDEMRVQFSVPETMMARAQPNDPVEAVTAAYPGRSYAGRIATRGTRIEEATRAVPAQAVFENRDGSLLPGMMLTLRIRAKPRQLVSVPEAALAPENGRQFVWTIDASDSAQRSPVELGVRERGWVEITAGIAAGDEVIVEGAGNLQPGARVRQIPRPGAAAVSMRNEAG
jgi:membrane fusion protein, multidrug efflux system